MKSDRLHRPEEESYEVGYLVSRPRRCAASGLGRKVVRRRMRCVVAAGDGVGRCSGGEQMAVVGVTGRVVAGEAVFE